MGLLTFAHVLVDPYGPKCGRVAILEAPKPDSTMGTIVMREKRLPIGQE